MFGDTTLFGQERWSATDLAQTLILSVQRINQLVKEGIIPAPIDGRYQPRAAVSSYVRHIRAQKSGSAKADAEVKKIQLENELRAIKLQQIAKTLVPVDRVQQDFFELARRIRDAILNLPSRLSGPFAAESSQEKIFDSLTKELHTVLAELSRAPIPPPGPPSEPARPLPAKDALAEVSDSQPADSTIDQAFPDRVIEDPDGRFSSGD